MVRDAYERLPEAFRQHCAGLVIQTEEFADRETLDAVGIENPYGLMGLYHGHGRPVQWFGETGMLPDRVFLYRSPILRFWRAGEDSLEQVITNVLVHEIAHHFGLSDEEIYGLEDEAEHP